MKHFLSFLLSCIFFFPACCQSNIIGVIDFYGLGRITEKEVRVTIGVKEGDSLDNFDKEEKIEQLKKIPGLQQAEIISVCCEGKKGQSILYIGISEKEGPVLSYYPAPEGKMILPKKILDAYAEFEKVFMEGVEKGEAGEDRSQGHSLMNYAPARAIQEKFPAFANEYFTILKDVLNHAADGEQRAIAAQVIAYAKDKNTVIDDLLSAVNDSEEGVRNNASRALALIAGFSARNPGLNIKNIPADPFLKMMNSIVWTDRNKAAAVLISLTETRDSTVLRQIRAQALTPVIEMSRWKSSGHAMMGWLLLGRMAGLSEMEINNLVFKKENRDTILEEMIKKIKATL